MSKLAPPTSYRPEPSPRANFVHLTAARGSSRQRRSGPSPPNTIAERLPDEGSQALLVDGGGLDGGNGFTIASHGEDLHAVGSTAPIFPGYGGRIVISPAGTRRLARVVPDPLSA
jgi:hypothetical protein